MLIIDVLDRGWEFEAGLAYQTILFPVLPDLELSVKQQFQALGERQFVVGARLVFWCSRAAAMPPSFRSFSLARVCVVLMGDVLAEALRATDVFVVPGEFGIQGQLFRQLVPVAPEDGLDVLPSIQPFPIGDPAAGVQTLTGVFPGQVE